MRYQLKDVDSIPTPALVFYKEAIKENIALAIKIAGNIERLRPHIKSHKTVEIPRMQAEAGITKFKTATISETEMLAVDGFEDIVLAYPLVGPSIVRFARLVKTYPHAQFAALTDSFDVVPQISRAAVQEGITIRLLVDIDPGMHRTGVSFEKTADLFKLIACSKNLVACGFHIYDGHNHDQNPSKRMELAKEYHKAAMDIKQELESGGFPVETIIMGGTPSFPCYAQLPNIELSPGTCFLNDFGYGAKFKDMHFRYAALLLTRVVSTPAGMVTLDLGYKAVASDPAPHDRVHLVYPDGDNLIPIDTLFVGQNEEHLIFAANIDAKPGDLFYALPTHICPSSALYENILAADNEGHITEQWQVRSRKRILSI
jgi:D-serine deaminase-like pyridoxal phosphate-dependent protein